MCEVSRKVKRVQPKAGPSFLDGHRHPWLYRAYNLAQLCFRHQHKLELDSGAP